MEKWMKCDIDPCSKPQIAAALETCVRAVDAEKRRRLQGAARCGRALCVQTAW